VEAAGHQLAALAGLHQARGAVGAHVEEGARLAVLAAHDDDRRPGVVEQHPVAGLGNIPGQAGQQRDLAEELTPLGLEARRVGVVLGGDAHGRLRQVGGPAVRQVGDQPPFQVPHGVRCAFGGGALQGAHGGHVVLRR
jgi:hypothetical protein